MARRSLQQQSVHDSIVRQTVQAFSGRGYTNIKADHIAHPNGAPEAFSSHRSDITAYDGLNRPIICEIETGDTIGSAETKEQLAAFRWAANQFGGQLHLSLPKSALGSARLLVSSWGIVVDQWWWAEAY